MTKILAVFLFTAILTRLMRAYALRVNLVDVPNQRSSHKVPTPRGGGVAIVLIAVLLALYFATEYTSSQIFFYSTAFAGLTVAAIGFVDDHGHVNAKWRLLTHFLCAAVALTFMPLPVLVFGDLTLEPNVFTFLVLTIAIVWLLNLYNFMDGIDGIAGMEAVTSLAGSALLLYLADAPKEYIYWPLLLSAAVAGFLVVNFPPAKIFMGDAGSGFLGFSLGLLACWHSTWSPNMFWSWLILLGIFVVDATLTLLRRILQGKKPYEAHRSHAYQHAAVRYNSHKCVTISVALINVFWLLPIAWLVCRSFIPGWLGLSIAYVPLVITGIWLRAGSEK